MTRATHLNHHDPKISTETKMKAPRISILIAAMMVAVVPALGLAQGTETQLADNKGAPAAKTQTTPAGDTSKMRADRKGVSKFLSTTPNIDIQHFRATDMRGLNVFEPPKEEERPYTGFKLNWGAAFTQQFQGLSHSSKPAPRIVNSVDANKLVEIGNGFNNANANLYLNAQVAKGIRVALTSYLSSRHHNETWVKDGYFLIDDSPIEVTALQNIMKYLTLRIGHFELNYGDAHFRRTDNGNAIYNPFVGNYIMDAFTTEIGAEAYVRKSGFMLMGGMTGGEVRGQVQKAKERAPSYLAKAGFDRQISEELRVRLMGSLYQTQKSVNNTLFSGDRAGSRYYSVLENTTSTETAQAWSGAIQPGFRSKVRAMQLNPFVKFSGLELFGVAEKAEGRAATETESREWTQYAGDVVYRFLADDRVFLGGRYNTAKGELAGITPKVSVKRYQLGGGWFLTPNVLMKAEYVNQKYNDFPTTDIRSGGKFKGFMVEGVVAF